VTTLDGAQVEVELGEQANVNLVGIVGPVGPVGPMGPPGGPMPGWFTPQQFGAVGDGVHDDTTAVQAAITAAGTAGTSGHGGVLYFAAGTYKCTAALHYNGNTTWAGAGPSASVLKCSAELWPGGTALAPPFVSAGTGFGQYGNWRMSNMAVLGPGTNRGYGNTLCKTSGIQTTPYVILDNVNISGFFAGLVQTSDHVLCYGVVSLGNYYGLEYPDNTTTFGSNAYYSCFFTRNTMASIHISGGSQAAGDYWAQNHLGWCPIAMFKTDWQNGWDASGNPVYSGGTASGSNMFINCVFENLSVEFVGNGVILDISAGPTTLGGATKLRGLGGTWSATYATTNPPLTAVCLSVWTFVLKACAFASELQLTTCSVPAGHYGFINLTAPGSRNLPQFTFPAVNLPANLYGSGTNWCANTHTAYHKVMAGAPSGVQYGAQGDAITVSANSLINVGDCVELTTVPNVQRATGTVPVFGVALTPSPGGLSVPLIVQKNGYGAINTTDASGTNPGALLYLDATTTYMVNRSNTAGKIVGVASSLINVISSQNVIPASISPQLK
jgi:hypothetical protein